MVDEVLPQLSAQFDAMYTRVGRPSIAPEKLLRAQLLQMLYSIRSVLTSSCSTAYEVVCLLRIALSLVVSDLRIGAERSTASWERLAGRDY